MDIQVLPYRLKSARRKKRLQKEDRDKQLLKLIKERSSLRNESDKLPIVPLEEPYQKGWKRLFVLKKEVLKSDRAEFYQRILDRINHVQYHYDESFKRKKRGKRHSKYDLDPPTLRPLYNWHADKLKLTDEERQHFNRVEYWSIRHRTWSVQYEFAEPWLFEVAVMPNIIFKVKLGDELLDQRLGYIDNHITNHALQYRINKLLGGGHNGWKNETEKLKYVNPFKNKPKWDVFEE